mmetsp:Transcript_170893/g.543047  ORF Transcript_170893/g.543047 Transcript_170893/m.543047 type:complete len:378 (+) Transcript_170893:80-1213(+)
MSRICMRILAPLLLTVAAFAAEECESETCGEMFGASLSLLQKPVRARGLKTNAKRTTVDEIKGYYAWEWSSSWAGPSGTNLGICCNGYSEVATALSKCTKTVSTLDEVKWISIGGNGENGHGIITPSVLATAGGSASKFSTAGFTGVMFDVEVVEGTNDDLTAAFTSAIQHLKIAGLQVGITTSHSGPVTASGGCDAATLVKAWVVDANLDIISPQLYSTGAELAPEFATTSSCPACTWSLFQGSKAKFAPSIVEASQYDATQIYFADQSITTAGYIQWKQTDSPTTTNWCGTSFEDASSACSTSCPGGTDAECGGGDQHCFADVTHCGSSPTTTNWCGTSFEDASSACSTSCPGGTDAECGGGDQHCFADITQCSR